LIEKNSEGDYVLTELGQRAVNILQNINENLNGDIELAPIIQNSRQNYIKKQLNTIFYIFMASIAIGAIVMGYFYLQPGSDISAPILLGSYAAMGIVIYGLNQARQNSPKYMHSFVDWLDWRLFGKNEARFTGRKTFVLAALGFTLGVLLGHGILGLIIGSILGASMEYTG